MREFAVKNLSSNCLFPTEAIKSTKVIHSTTQVLSFYLSTDDDRHTGGIFLNPSKSMNDRDIKIQIPSFGLVGKMNIQDSCES